MGATSPPKKRLGQHFLVDQNIVRKIVAAATLGPQDAVLENIQHRSDHRNRGTKWRIQHQFRLNSSQTVQPRPPKQVKENGFHLIIGMVCG